MILLTEPELQFQTSSTGGVEHLPQGGGTSSTRGWNLLKSVTTSTGGWNPDLDGDLLQNLDNFHGVVEAKTKHMHYPKHPMEL